MSLLPTLLIVSVLTLQRSSALKSPQGSNPNFVDEQTRLASSLLNGYEKTIKPSANLSVTVSLSTRHIMLDTGNSGSAEFQMIFRQGWHDSRLKFDDSNGATGFITLNTDEEIPIWVPDTIFRNEIESRLYTVMTPNRYIRVYPNGDVLYSTRISIKVVAPGFGLNDFPFDARTVKLEIVSYAHLKHQIQYKWKENGITFFTEMYTNFHLKNFSMKNDEVRTNTGSYSILEARFEFVRSSYKYVFHFFLPIGILTLTAGCSLFMGGSEMCVRILLIFCCLVTSMALSLFLQLKVDPGWIQPTQALTTFTGLNGFLLVLALLESILVASINKKSLSAEDGVIKTFRSGTWCMRIDLLFKFVYLCFLTVFIIGYWIFYSGYTPKSPYQT